MPREALLKESKVISPCYAQQRMSTFRLQIKSFFSTVYNILASFSDLNNPPVQYYMENSHTDFVVVPRRPPGA